MTIKYPDISHYQNGLSLNGAVACIAKATEGTGYHDSSYSNFKAQSASLGIPFAGYHFLRRGGAVSQADFALSVVGKQTPLMLDVETAVDGSVCTLGDVLAFIDRYKGQGGILTLAYIPHWFWQGKWGSPSLSGLTARHVGLVSSSYTSYSDGGVGWNSYGGVTPVVWQYTASQSFNGQHVDFNAFKGTVAEFRQLLGGQTQEDTVTPAEFLAILNDPNVAAKMQAFSWQYNGRGLAGNDLTDAGNISTLFAFNEILLTTRALAAKIDISPAELAAIKAAATAGAALSAAQIAAAVVAALPVAPAGTLTKADVETAVRTVFADAGTI